MNNRCLYDTRPLPIEGGHAERRAGHVGELWWLPVSSSSWLLDGNETLEAEITTLNASAVRIPADPGGDEHVLTVGDQAFAVAFIDGEAPENTVVEADLELLPLEPYEDGQQVVGWSVPAGTSTVIELWEGDVELVHENALLTVPNTHPSGSGIGGTAADAVSARRISLIHGVVGAISTVVVVPVEQP